MITVIPLMTRALIPATLDNILPVLVQIVTAFGVLAYHIDLPSWSRHIYIRERTVNKLPILIKIILRHRLHGFTRER